MVACIELKELMIAVNIKIVEVDQEIKVKNIVTNSKNELVRN